MTRFLFRLMPALVAAFAMFNIAARALGTLRPPHPALAGFTEGCEGQPSPCWYGIVPGVTTAGEAGQIAERYFVRRSVIEGFPLAFDSPQISGLTFIGFNYDLSLIVKHIILYFDEQVYLGDVLGVVGEPDEVQLLDRLNKARLVYQYPGGVIGLDTGRDIDGLNPRKRGSLYLTLSVESSRGAAKVFSWAGFQRESYYCEQDNTLAFCS